MASKLSTILDGLQQQLFLLNELVARVATLPPADNSCWATVGDKLLQLYSDVTVHITIIQLLQSRTTQDVQPSAELDAFAQTLQAGTETLKALQAELITTSSGESTKEKSSPALTVPPTESAITAQQVGQLSLSLQAATASLFRSFSLEDITTSPLAVSNSNNLEAPALQEAFLRRPFALTGADVSSLVASLGNPDPKSAIEAISTQINDFAKEWAAKQGVAGPAIDPSVLIHLWCGNTWSLLRDMQGQLLSPDPNPVPSKEDVLLVAKTLVGARVRQSASNHTSIAFIGASGCGKSSLINAIVGFALIADGSEYCIFIRYATSESFAVPTVVPCRVRHQPDLSEPILEIAIEPFRIGLELLRQLDFTRQCSQWEVDYNLLSIGHPEAPESFRRVWDAWMLLPLTIKEILTILERPDFELAPKTAGLDQVRKMVRTTSYNTEYLFYTYLYESLVISTQLLYCVVNSASYLIRSTMTGPLLTSPLSPRLILSIYLRWVALSDRCTKQSNDVFVAHKYSSTSHSTIVIRAHQVIRVMLYIRFQWVANRGESL